MTLALVNIRAYLLRHCVQVELNRTTTQPLGFALYAVEGAIVFHD